MVMHSDIYRMLAEAEPIPACADCGRYVTNYPEGPRCDYCTKEQAKMTAVNTTPTGCYIIIVNMPGYLPESDPYAVDTIEEAREAVQSEAGFFAEDEGANLELADDGLSAEITYTDSVRMFVVEAVADYTQTAAEYNAGQDF